MKTMMEWPMSQRREKKVQKQEAKMSAAIRARSMLIEVAGPRGWSDTREGWLSRGARKLGVSYSRAKKLFYQEPIRLGADEYADIERAYAAAHASMAQMVAMAGDADLRRRAGTDGTGNGTAAQGGQVDENPRGRSAATPPAR
jgi:hypothetical protein